MVFRCPALIDDQETKTLLLQYLNEIIIFGGLDSNEIELIESISSVKEFKENEVILTENEIGDQNGERLPELLALLAVIPGIHIQGVPHPKSIDRAGNGEVHCMKRTNGSFD